MMGAEMPKNSACATLTGHLRAHSLSSVQQHDAQCHLAG
jgi:hypothetical protein